MERWSGNEDRAEFEQSLKKYPPIAPGTPDPYTPPK